MGFFLIKREFLYTCLSWYKTEDIFKKSELCCSHIVFPLFTAKNCTKFYNVPEHSGMLSKICIDDVCRCAEGKRFSDYLLLYPIISQIAESNSDPMNCLHAKENIQLLCIIVPVKKLLEGQSNHFQ